MTFTIRDILWLTTLTGVLLFAWQSRVDLIQARTDRAFAKLEAESWRSAFLKDRPYLYEYRVKNSDWFPGVIYSPGQNAVSKSVSPIAQHWYKPSASDPAKCEVCGYSGAYYGIHHSKPLTDDDYPIIPAGD